MPQQREPLRRVHYGRGIRHRTNRRETSRSSGSGAACDGFFVALAGLAEVNVQIDESRSDDQTAGIKLFIGAATDLVRQGNLSDTAVAQKNVHGRVDLRRRVDNMATFDKNRSRFGLIVLHFFHSLSIPQNPWLISPSLTLAPESPCA